MTSEAFESLGRLEGDGIGVNEEEDEGAKEDADMDGDDILFDDDVVVCIVLLGVVWLNCFPLWLV